MNGAQEYCYVLVRVARHREIATMPALEKSENLLLDEAVQKQIEDIKVGDASSVVEFIRSFGSHYITSFITGNSLYQVKYNGVF